MVKKILNVSFRKVSQLLTFVFIHIDENLVTQEDLKSWSDDELPQASKTDFSLQQYAYGKSEMLAFHIVVYDRGFSLHHFH